MESNYTQSKPQQLLSWVREQKYKLAGATFVASMVGSFIMVGRNPYLTSKQKLVQARVPTKAMSNLSAQRKEVVKQFD
ncbi:hypothetical protein PENCOP_c008G06510 [Penicillium coprophilum]|uniref:HIG1 domain-containing protein n=1 Tax=Penicillium coprophilum TaxID=36646 RepID=A0A1V6UJ83_9EURO|nr:hypothetical protein PENCOP_c008G06510 [Penicillium coprophilum]